MTSALRELHVPGRPLVLPNIWDVPSALAVAGAGHPALATSSAAVAAVLGYEDGHQAPAAEMFAAAARIAARVDVPLTVDCEGGYGLAPAEFVEALLDTGAAGANLEDTDHSSGGLIEAARQADHLAAIRAAAGEGLVINARVDVFIQAAPGTDPGSLLEEAVERARLYLEAGADCVYPILLHDPTLATAFCAAVAPAAVNLLGSYMPAAGRISLADAAAAGAARVSFGPDLWRAANRALEALVPPFVPSF
ncbi:2-Methylisocitrate lyase, PEP mutase family [Nakamurella panacisegetis]|uniref:2-Methylisocitrate lyase, PEP mutase family n=1 Tax=Nakamurella panacisegetis TaxID=1090615 RepID=A0A1H0JSR3_9ACTN|nr:isocitrate lyase/phosphoenolpyruvate mutase family protein [Nakamurella panacisegetis]SDO46512.1 2-Methylisocitrate lyase, PEP mutase family [Nakamurella panacisegetis]